MCQAQRSGVRAERVVRLDGFGDEIRTRRLRALVNDLPEIAVGPAVEAAGPYGSQIVRDEVSADRVALVDYGPQRAGCGLPSESVRVAQAGCIHPARAGRRV